MVTVSLYEHLRRLSTSETLTILKPLVPNFSLATPNKNHGWVTLILYEHPRRPSTTEILTILGLRSSKLEKLFLTGFFGRHFAFLTKTSVAEDLSWRLRMKMKMHMQLKSTRIKMVHVDSRRHSNFSETPKMVFYSWRKIKHLSLYEHPRRPSTRETLTIFDLGSSELEKLSSLKIRRD